ncbi:MAG: outer membrane beta-barrel protein [Bacteroidota bacterium]
MVKHLPLLLLFFLCFSLSPSLNAQWLVGGGVTLGGTPEGRLGLNVKTTFPITGRLVLGPNLTFFAAETDDTQTADTKTQFTALNLDAQLQFDVIDNLVMYPLAGVQIAFLDFETDIPGLGTETENKSDVGINLGGGGRYQFLDRLSGFGELAYTVGGMDQLNFTFGVLFHLVE